MVQATLTLYKKKAPTVTLNSNLLALDTVSATADVMDSNVVLVAFSLGKKKAQETLNSNSLVQHDKVQGTDVSNNNVVGGTSDKMTAPETF